MIFLHFACLPPAPHTFFSPLQAAEEALSTKENLERDLRDRIEALQADLSHVQGERSTIEGETADKLLQALAQAEQLKIEREAEAAARVAVEDSVAKLESDFAKVTPHPSSLCLSVSMCLRLRASQPIA